MITSERCKNRFIGHNIVAIHHEWVLIEEYKSLGRVHERSWYCKFCRRIEEVKVNENR